MKLLYELNLVSISMRLLLAAVVGGVLGLERERRNRPAGFRTYMLVCVGSALVMMTNQYVFETMAPNDPVRMGAQVISGIGFLGAGAIMVTGKNRIRGITTAAGLWTAACCGLAIGIGFYEGALLGGLLIFAIVTVLRRLEDPIRKNLPYMELYLEFDPRQPFGTFIEFSRKHDLDIFDIQMQKSRTADERVFSVVLQLRNRGKLPHTEVLELLAQAPGINYLEELR